MYQQASQPNIYQNVTFNQYGMRWFLFMVWGYLIYSMINSISSALTMFKVSDGQGIDKMETLSIVTGILYLGIAVLSFYTRKLMLYFSVKTPKYVVMCAAAPLVVTIFMIIGMCVAMDAELKDVIEYLSRHKAEDLERVFTELNRYRKELVSPIIMTEEMFVKQWENEKYKTNSYCPEEKVYITKKGDYVRSKSEVLLADMYYELGIPYRYEAQLCLKNGKKKYPDFTLLKASTKEIIYHEHMGLMDNDEYRRANFEKLDEYRRNGIYLGKNLIITYETKN